ncbi:DotU family type IV/VI secretion system protein [Aureliella helgolandensis]|uniref:Type IV / VI secretion system DotU domain-containing protein n=1 Tax=Aureliella helgolandensis TaxID=2527968 RepID=A0A518G532_9BACT|nr:DotU family type IV/VI secretion system protein [Aureliella helgolandensis]QDV23707.1 hypothetical protein Q31a_20120 [Aureliella helgolandensis]
MNDAFSNIVHPVIEYGLSLKSRIDAGAELDLEYQQSRLRDLLLSEDESQLHAEFGSDQQPANLHTATDLSATPGRMTNRFWGVRYGLVCWLDELFTNCPQWEQAWNENKLESQLYGTNDRAWKFWEQARLAQTRAGLSAFECFYLCASLGFRGELRDQPDKLRTWCQQAKLRLGSVSEIQFPYVTEVNHFDNAPPLRGATMFNRMAVSCWIATLVIIPLIAFAFMNRLGD